jgi:prepilin-type processing-associated H-X9-DG protein
MYVDDFHLFPRAAVYHYQPARLTFWYNDLGKYTVPWPEGSAPRTNIPAGLYTCPSFPRLVNLQPIGSYGYLNAFGYTASYAYNDRGADVFEKLGLGLGGRRLNDGPADASAFTWTKEDEVVSPSDMLAVGDAPLRKLPSMPPGSGDKVYADPHLDSPLHVNPLSADSWAAFAQPTTQQLRHSGRFNTLFCDGHVEQARFEVLYGRQDSRLNRWNEDNLTHRNMLP